MVLRKTNGAICLNAVSTGIISKKKNYKDSILRQVIGSLKSRYNPRNAVITLW